MTKWIWYAQKRGIFSLKNRSNEHFAISQNSLSVVKGLAKAFMEKKIKTKALQVSDFNYGPCVHSFAFNSEVFTTTCNYNEVE